MPSPNRRSAAFRLPLTCLVVSTILALLLAACGGSSAVAPTTTSKPNVTAPSDLLKRGTLVIGTDPTYVPMEYIDTKTNNYTGFDIDLISAMAAHMGLKVEIDKTRSNHAIPTYIPHEVGARSRCHDTSGRKRRALCR